MCPCEDRQGAFVPREQTSCAAVRRVFCGTHGVYTCRCPRDVPPVKKQRRGVEVLSVVMVVGVREARLVHWHVGRYEAEAVGSGVVGVVLGAVGVGGKSVRVRAHGRRSYGERVRVSVGGVVPRKSQRAVVLHHCEAVQMRE